MEIFKRGRGGQRGGRSSRFVGDLEDRVAAIALRGIEPARREVYDSGVTKVTYQDADGNEISFGGSPAPVILRSADETAESGEGGAGGW